MVKKMTIEKLAEAMKGGFERVDKQMQKGFQEARIGTDEQFQESDKRTDKKIDDLAIMVQKGFEGIQSRMATKDDLNNLRNELHETREILAQAIKDLEIRMSAYMNFNKEEVDRLKSWMQSIEERVSFLENKNHPRPTK